MNRRPPWWPENEPFPPAQFRRMRGRFFGRFLAFFGLFIFLSVSASLLLFWFIVAGFGLLPGGAHPGFPFPFAFVCFLLTLVVVSLGIASRGLGRMTAPLDQMIDAAGRVAAGDYSTRVTERGPREVRTLARAFNGMSERLQAHDEQRRRMMADVAHELRTPLAVIQGNLEGLLDQVYPRDDAHLASLLEETRLLTRLVEDLRTLALSE
ncbi:MAG: HAMP domain-containing protein, partial [Chloroflexi bacterium]